MSRKAWFAIVCGALVVAISFGIRQTFGLFMRPIAMDLTITRQAFALAIAVQQVVWGVAQPFAGAVADRLGAGRAVVVGGLFYAVGLWILASTDSGVGVLLGLGVFVGLGLAATTFAVVLGAVGRTVTEAQRSTALGIATAGGSLGLFLFLPVAQALMEIVGWQNALLALTLVALSMSLLAFGLAGNPSSASPATGGKDNQTLAAALAEAATHPGFWFLTAGFFVCGFQVTFIATHLPAYLTDKGISPMVGATALALVGVTNMVGSFLWGLAGGYLRKKYLLAALYLVRGAIIFAFLMVPLSEISAMVFAATIGFLWFGTVPLTSGLVAQIFGVRYMSTLFGVVFFSHQLGSFLGAWLGGLAFDLAGSYQPVWVAAIALSVLAALLHWPIADGPVVRLRSLPAPA